MAGRHSLDAPFQPEGFELCPCPTLAFIAGALVFGERDALDFLDGYDAALKPIDGLGRM